MVPGGSMVVPETVRLDLHLERINNSQGQGGRFLRLAQVSSHSSAWGMWKVLDGWTVVPEMAQLDLRQILQHLMVVLAAQLGGSTVLETLRSWSENQSRAGW